MNANSLSNLTGGKRGKASAKLGAEVCSECGGAYETGEDRTKPCGLCFDVAPWQDYLGAFSLFLFATGERKRSLRQQMREEFARLTRAWTVRPGSWRRFDVAVNSEEGRNFYDF